MLDIKRLTFLAAAIVATSATGLVGQEATGSMLGTIREAGGRPSARTTLVISGTSILGQRSIVTNDQGEYRIPLLPPGSYVLTVSKQGFISSKADVRISAGQILRQDFTLRPVSVSTAEVEIVGTSAAVDKTETKTASTYSIETLVNLPGGLSSYAALNLAPGVSGQTDYPVVRGGLTGQTQFLVNGISVRDNAVRQGRQYEVVIDDLTEDIAVIQSPLNSKYGNASGGMVNLVTKTGKNEFEGSIRVPISRSSWSARTYPELHDRLGQVFYDGSTVGLDALSKNYEITILGPIIPGHLTFAYGARLAAPTYTSYTLTNLATLGRLGLPGYSGAAAWTYGAVANVPTTVGGFRTTSTQQYKLFWMINQNHQLDVFYTDDTLGPPYFDSQTANIDAFATFEQTSTRPFWGFNYRGIIGDRGVIEVRGGKRSSDVLFSSGPGDPIYVRAWPNNPVFTGNGPNGETAGTPVTSLLATTGLTTWSYLTNGDYGYGIPESRNAETYAANFNWFNGGHNIDVGVERLREIFFGPQQYGPNQRMFYVPGRRADGMYAVFNFVGSAAQTSSLYADARNGSSWIPEMRTANSADPNADLKNYDTTLSFYANDLWTINSNWSVMLGLRQDSWKIEDRTGTSISSSAISPRFELKYDVLGNNQHLLSASYAHFYGTISQGYLGAYFSRRPGNIVTRNFWSTGTGTPENPQWVTQEDLINPANYGFQYSYADNDILYAPDPGLKPDHSVEYTFSYRRAFPNGGSFRATAVYRDMLGLWYRKGTGTPVLTNPLLGQYGGYFSTLEADPRNERDHKGIELEWSYPLYRSANQNLMLQGNWTINRTKARTQWREGNSASAAAEYYELKDALGILFDDYNPLGEMRFSNHNVLKTWITWTVGNPKGIRNVFSLIGEYSTGGPFSLSGTRTINTNDPIYGQFISRTSAGNWATGNPTSYSYFYNGRGRFTDVDFYGVDLQWNSFIPIKGKLQAFCYFTVYNVFNSIIKYGVPGLWDDGTSMARYGGGTVAWNNPDYTYTVSDFHEFGAIDWMGANRSFSVNFGIKF
jgi:hypothetical protein